MLELPVRRLPYTASRGAALVFYGPDVDDACRPDGLDDGPVDGPGVDLDGIGEPAFAGGEGRELDRRRLRRLAPSSPPVGRVISPPVRTGIMTEVPEIPVEQIQQRVVAMWLGSFYGSSGYVAKRLGKKGLREFQDMGAHQV
ncbi:MAG: hypothetical protein METHAR1v1_1860001, partial [Methanothrix sp.]